MDLNLVVKHNVKEIQQQKIQSCYIWNNNKDA